MFPDIIVHDFDRAGAVVITEKTQCYEYVVHNEVVIGYSFFKNSSMFFVNVMHQVNSRGLCLLAHIRELCLQIRGYREANIVM